MKELVIKIGWGGLGDHLLYTPIPKLAKEKYDYDKVYISNHSSYRYPGIKELVWGYNPYVDGFSDKDGELPAFDRVQEDRNILDELILFCGLPDDGIRFREPIIYYKPKIISHLENAVIFDPNFITLKGHPSGAIVEDYFKRENIIITHQMRLLRKKNSSIRCSQEISSKSLEHFCDIIYSCKRVFCLVSGSAALAASIGKSVTAFYVDGANLMFNFSKLHKYINISR